MVTTCRVLRRQLAASRLSPVDLTVAGQAGAGLAEARQQMSESSKFSPAIMDCGHSMHHAQANWRPPDTCRWSWRWRRL